MFDGARAAKDLEAIVQEHRRIWGSLPYDKYVFLNLLTEARRRPRAQELHGADGEPLGDAHAPRLPRVARAGQPRVLPRLERQAAAAGGARAVRLRERGPHAQPLDRRRRHRLLRRSGGASRRACRRARSTSTRSRPRSRSCRRRRAGSCSRRSWRRSTPGSSTTGPTRTRRTRRSATTRRARCSAFCSTRKIRKATNGAKSLDDVMRAAYQQYSGDARLHARGVPGGRRAGGGHRA